MVQSTQMPGVDTKTLTVHNPNKLPTVAIEKLLSTQHDLKDLSKVNYQKLKASLDKHGFIFPIAVWPNEGQYHLIDGHQRQRVISREYPGTKVPVITIPASNLQEAAEILLKVTSQYGTITQEGIDQFIARYELPEFEVYEAVHFDALPLLGTTDEPEVEEDEAPEVDEDNPPESRVGETYQLGRHRVMCASATDEEAINALFGEQKIDLYITDPPYNVDYTGRTKKELKIDNDAMDDVEFLAFLTDANRRADEHMKNGASFYIFHADLQGHNFRASVRDAGWDLRQCLIWVKQTMVMGRQDYQWQHEPILYGWKSGASHRWFSDRKQTTVLNFDRPSRNADHPTMKPITILAYLINNSSKAEDLVFDSFLGSGSTLIACEQTDRTCYGTELDPRYVDVIRKRYANLIGEEDWVAATPKIQT